MQQIFKFLAVTAITSLTCSLAAAGTIYVGSGSNANDRNATNSIDMPYRSLAKAALVVKPGDTVLVMNGTYSPFTIRVSGTSEAQRITWKAYPGHTPEIISKGWNAIDVAASYQTIDGLTLTGNNDNVKLADAEADMLIDTVIVNNERKSYPGSPLYNGNGISLQSTDTNFYHHLTIRNCTIRKFGGGGVGAGPSDYFVVENNKIYENAWYSRYANSGISIFPKNFDSAAGYHNIFRGNTIWNNRGFVKWKNPPNNAAPRYSDGNGIIVDITPSNYAGRTLVANNLVFNNGGSGVNLFKTRRVDVLNNTLYKNGDKVGYPELDSNQSTDTRFYNNVAYGRGVENGGKINGNYGGSQVIFDYNVYFNGTVSTSGVHDLVNVDPGLVDPSFDPATANFQLRGNSPAIDSGVRLAGVSPLLDILNVARTAGTGPDIGAYEYSLKPYMASALNANARVNTAFSYRIYFYNYPKSFNASGLPPGLIVDTKTGFITGKPTRAGTYRVTVSATNTVGTTTAVVTVLVSPAVI